MFVALLELMLPVEHTREKQRKETRESADDLSVGQRLKGACEAVKISRDGIKKACGALWLEGT